MGHVDGDDDGVGYGVFGHSNVNWGVRGESHNGIGVGGFSDFIGVSGHSLGNWPGVEGTSKIGSGVGGYSKKNKGVEGRSYSGIGVYGDSDEFIGVSGSSDNYIGVSGFSDNFMGVRGWSYSGMGVRGYSESGYGIYGYSISGYAAYLDGRVYIGGGPLSVGSSYSGGTAVAVDGDVRITGNIEKAGGSFKIDHPLDPANKYLCHSFVESPDMKNVYDGVVALDDKGEAEIELPDWFGTLNKDFRYQLTAIGAPGPNLYIAEEIISDTTTNDRSNNNNSRFKIAGGTLGMKVSWQVTGIRKDPWANTHRVQVEEYKPDKERGYYIYPDLYGQPEENGISRLLFPEQKARATHK